MYSVGTLVFKIIDKMAYVGVARLGFIPIIAQVFEDFPLEYWVVFSVAFCTQYFESKKPVLTALSEKSTAGQ